MFPSGEAHAVLVKAEAKSQAIRVLSEALSEQVNTTLTFFFKRDHSLSSISVLSDQFYFVSYRTEMRQPR